MNIIEQLFVNVCSKTDISEERIDTAMSLIDTLELDESILLFPHDDDVPGIDAMLALSEAIFKMLEEKGLSDAPSIPFAVVYKLGYIRARQDGA